MVHRTHADLLFKLNVETQWAAMVKLRKDPNMRRVVATPEYRVAFENAIIDELNKYVERQQSMAEAAGRELHWEPPTIIWDHIAEKYVVVRYDRNAEPWPLITEGELL
jgi:hypothetical protein